MIPGDLLSAFPHRQFHTLPGLLDSWAALPNSNPNACMPMQGGSLYHFYDGLWYDPAERRTHDLPCERRTRYRLSQPDTVRSNMFRDHTFDAVYITFVRNNILTGEKQTFFSKTHYVHRHFSKTHHIHLVIRAQCYIKCISFQNINQ